MLSMDTLSLFKEMMASPHDAASRAGAALAEHDDPRVRMIAEMWASQRAEATGDEPDAEPADDVSAAEVRPEPDMARIRDHIRLLTDHLRYERQLRHEMARALGACHCLGEDAECGDCGGAGTPGTRIPDRRAFAHFVLPVIMRMKQDRRRTAVSETPREPAGSEAPGERSST
ncbi:MAG TPA: hypothetical protein VFT13_01750 [Candidatus Krumholzibacteria bacterium]|nr:hypothetical protein [Candidatus Krumholzibacteria bacterium]